MKRLFKLCLCLLVFAPVSFVQATELTGRFSMLGTTAQAKQGDLGYVDADNKTLTADQQSLRLMLDGVRENGEWSIHVKTVRQHLNGYVANEVVSSDVFRYSDLSNNWRDEQNGNDSTRIGYEIDRIAWKQRFDNITLGIGRQPIDWGSGRFWQPLNVFGAFAPTDLDTDFKPGIDAAVLDWYPTAFSSLTAVYVLAPEDNAAIENSAALNYRRQTGTVSEMTLLAGRVTGNDVIGASFESEWQGMGWRIETAHYNLDQSEDNTTFWIAGVDYQFSDGSLLAVEWYNNSLGASSETSLVDTQTGILAEYGLQQQLGKNMLGILVDKDITPLLHGTYMLLLGTLKDADNHRSSSLLHQLNLIYSVSNESDLLLSLLYGNGKGVDSSNELQSEFGSIPASLTMRLRFYF